MGFFQDLKEDLSQAVNELIPEEENEGIKEESREKKADPTEEKEVTIEELEKILLEDGQENTDADEVIPEHISDDAVEEESLDSDYLSEEDDFTEEDNFTEEDFSEEIPVVAVQENIAESFPTGKISTEEISEDKNSINKSGDKGETRTMEVRNTAHAGAEATDETAIITAGMTIRGNLESMGSVDIQGTVVGNIDILGKLNITGNVQGDSKAAEVFADSANISGEINSEGSVKIGQSSVVIGNIIATSAVIAGAVKGDIDVKGPVILDTSAIVMGNIKSKSVQINNGAVIEGMCSQCYADVNPISFFDDYKGKKK